jgi:hypothetical protein
MRVTAYEFGKIHIDGKLYTSDVIVTCEGVEDSWWRKEGHRLHTDDLETIVEKQPEVLVVGTGYFGRMRILQETESYLVSRNIRLIGARTGDAVNEFNQLQGEPTKVVAAFHLTC